MNNAAVGRRIPRRRKWQRKWLSWKQRHQGTRNRRRAVAKPQVGVYVWVYRCISVLYVDVSVCVSCVSLLRFSTWFVHQWISATVS